MQPVGINAVDHGFPNCLCPCIRPKQCNLPALQGKLRMLYECYPMAMLVEKAGGRAIDGKQ